MKTIRTSAISLLLLLLLATAGYGQQDPQYTQYMFNGMAFNPAYAGSRGTVSGGLLLRTQWTQLDGAPETGSFFLHAPTSNERHGFGVSVVHDRLGITRQNFLTASYAYRLPVAGGMLALGLRGGVTNFTNRYDDLNLISQGDPANYGGNQSAWLPRAGTGIYFNTDRFYIGASAPNVLAGRYYRFNDQVAQAVAAEQEIHYFGTMGVVIPLGENLDFKPSIVAKYVDDAPMEFDLNANLLFRKQFWIGAGYRTGDALLFIVEYMSFKGWRLGYAYDYTVSQLGKVNTGSHELMLGFDLGLTRTKIITPRYF